MIGVLTVALVAVCALGVYRATRPTPPEPHVVMEAVLDGIVRSGSARVDISGLRVEAWPASPYWILRIDGYEAALTDLDALYDLGVQRIRAMRSRA